MREHLIFKVFVRKPLIFKVYCMKEPLIFKVYCMREPLIFKVFV